MDGSVIYEIYKISQYLGFIIADKYGTDVYQECNEIAFDVYNLGYCNDDCKNV